MLTEDIKLKLLAKKPIDIDGVLKIYPLTLDEIVDIGYTEYKILLTNLIADIKDFNISSEYDLTDITSFHIILGNFIYGNDEYRNIINSAFKLFIKEEISVVSDSFIVGNIDDNRIISNDVFQKMKYFLKLQNCIEDKSEKEDKCANEKAEEIRRKIMKGRQSIEKNNSIEFSDLISVVASKSNSYNLLNIYDLSLYQFNDQFKRIQMIEEYDIGIHSLLAGAKADEIKLKHYIRKI